MDFYCNASAGIGQPVFIMENPQGTGTYFFEWQSSAACPVSHSPTVDCPVNYEDNWLSLVARGRPTWFDDFKFGIFLHWGLYSVPSFKTEWYWNQLQ